MDKVTQALVEVLRQALTEPGEQRLYKSGKLPGLFPSRAGVSAEAAALALRDGLLEVARTETKGKLAVEWVRVTPKGVEFLHGHDSPVAALRQLRETLQVTQEGVPGWLAEVRKNIDNLSARLADEVQNISRRLEALGRRVDEAIARAAAGPQVSEQLIAAVPWARAAVAYLDRRRATGAAAACPLPELFTAVKGERPDLSLTDFHAGLRRLQDWGALRLLPFEGTDGLPEPEHALLDGVMTCYYVTR